MSYQVVRKVPVENLGWINKAFTGLDYGSFEHKETAEIYARAYGLEVVKESPSPVEPEDMRTAIHLAVMAKIEEENAQRLERFQHLIIREAKNELTDEERDQLTSYYSLLQDATEYEMTAETHQKTFSVGS
jgi:hypothetical protein